MTNKSPFHKADFPQEFPLLISPHARSADNYSDNLTVWMRKGKKLLTMHLRSLSLVSNNSILHLLSRLAKQMYISAPARCIPKHCLVPRENGLRYLVSRFSSSGPSGGRPVTGSASQRDGWNLYDDDGNIVSSWCR